ncbi:nucleoside triphosphate pyrophosphohydrolase [Aureimonas populi]|uniref:Nucleoside triphosphate pyrophosphohydrolase n=1 Tax=Aureimonas populi TaxID=1701758 RepID=A0ABW5CKP9_9HYPH|nr:nucleoside triphosphate pyrophosphohydrolase [Aureimonas populi]
MQPSRDVTRLVEIMRALRDPQAGCPWDVEQDFDSIVPFTIEETYEVVDAIERRDPDDLREELGDLLLQVVYFAQLAAEAELFDFSDVVETVTTKMIRRHPHVFGDAQARNADAAQIHWARIKAEEKAARASLHAERATRNASGMGNPEWPGSPEPDGKLALLDAVAGSFPALMLAQKIQAKAASVGFDWTEPAPILDKLREEADELAVALVQEDRDAQEDELGDILFCAVNLGRRLDIEPEKALRRTVMKFRERFGKVERALITQGRSLSEASLPEMEALWQAAKRDEGTTQTVAPGSA